MTDADYMARALQLAERGRGRTSPNPMVGAVVVSPDGIVIGSGFHKRAGEPHAEIHALRAAGARAVGGTLYCTLEPCCHYGRTGPCVEQIVAAGIARVVIAVEDPNPLVAGGGVRYLRAHGVGVTLGVGAREATRLNDAFFTFTRRGRPYVVAKIAVSLDGRVASGPGLRSPMTGSMALRRSHLLRAEVDAIGVGSGTILADDPLLTARAVFRARPLARVIFDRRLRTPPAARVFSTLEAGPVIIMTSAAASRAAAGRAAALVRAGATIEELDQPDFAAGLARLAGRQITSLLLEGGPAVHAAAVAAGVVDRLQLFVAPRWFGNGGLRWLDGTMLPISGLSDLSAEPCGEDLIIEGYVHRVD